VRHPIYKAICLHSSTWLSGTRIAERILNNPVVFVAIRMSQNTGDDESDGEDVVFPVAHLLSQTSPELDAKYPELGLRGSVTCKIQPILNISPHTDCFVEFDMFEISFHMSVLFDAELHFVEIWMSTKAMPLPIQLTQFTFTACKKLSCMQTTKLSIPTKSPVISPSRGIEFGTGYIFKFHILVYSNSSRQGC
jgi:hypothetical protein